MLTALIVVAVIGYVFAVPSPEKKTAETRPPPEVIVIHHRPVQISADIRLIQLKIAVAEAAAVAASRPVRLPAARLLNPSTAIERYRSQERNPS